jgi:hypothetical protein
MPAIEAVELFSWLSKGMYKAKKKQNSYLNTANIALTTLEEAVIFVANFLSADVSMSHLSTVSADALQRDSKPRCFRPSLTQECS